MADELPVVWPAEPHTLAKHTILRVYLQAWMPILANQSKKVGRSSELRYVDGFAGPGIYERNEPGSPIVAIRTAIDHSQRFAVPIRFTFIEEREDRCERLKLEISKLTPETKRCKHILIDPVLKGDCSTELSAILDRTDRQHVPFGPAMVFLDQFGYSDVPIELVARLLAKPQCEVLTYLNWSHLNRFISDPTKHAGIDRAMGSNDWAPAIKQTASNRKRTLFTAYKRALREQARAEHVIDFSMHGETGELLYWLFFCTNNIRGVEEMKRAMWNVDSSGSFRFSDGDDPEQPLLLKGCDQRWLAQRLLQQFDGQNVSVEQVRLFTLTSTPCYIFKGALEELEKMNRLSVIGGRKSGQRGYSDPQMSIRFDSSGRRHSQSELFGN